MNYSARLGALAAVLLTLPAAMCGEMRVVEHLPTPPERLVCERAGTRPTIPPAYTIDWSQVRTVAQAKAEHEKYVATILTREGIVAGYVLKVEGNLWRCWNNVEWRRQYEAGIGG